MGKRNRKLTASQPQMVIRIPHALECSLKWPCIGPCRPVSAPGEGDESGVHVNLASSVLNTCQMAGKAHSTLVLQDTALRLLLKPSLRRLHRMSFFFHLGDWPLIQMEKL